MTKLLEDAFEKVQALSPDMQDQAAHMLLLYAGNEGAMIYLMPAEEADLMEAQAEMARADFATDAEVHAVLSKYRVRDCAIQDARSSRSMPRSATLPKDRRPVPPRLSTV